VKRGPIGKMVLLLLLVAGVGRAQDKQIDEKDPSMNRPGKPRLGAVKETISSAVKEAAGAAAGVGAARDSAAKEDGPAPTDAVSRAVILRRKTLREEDFVDNDESNRDPFKSFMHVFVDRGATKRTHAPAIFEKFALEELKLIAVVSGDAQPRAMFRDPGGLGQTIKRGDYVSKSGARVTKILSDRVILEIAETSTSGEPRAIEKAVLVHPEEEAQK
jgi:type IV pilus assembly protein PilP